MEFTNINEEMTYIVKRNNFIKDCSDFLEENNYIKVDINYFEPYEEFIEQNKRIKKASMVKVMKPDGNVAILRPDITTNIIKQVVNKWEEGSRLKLYYDANIFRQGKGGLETIRQFGLEQLGSSSFQAEKEVLNTVSSLLDRLKVDYRIRLGSSALINALFDALNLEKNLVYAIKSAIQAKNQADLDALLSRIETSKEKNFLQEILTLEGSKQSVFEALKRMDIPSCVQDALDDLSFVTKELKQTKRLWIDLSLIPEYDYYNGLVLEGYIKKLPTPLFQGGRYDSLTKQFGQSINAFGVSFDFQALMQEVINND